LLLWQLLLPGHSFQPSEYVFYESSGNRFSLSSGRVALLGIARRIVSVEFEQKKIRLTHHKHLSLNIKSIGDWICSKRIGKNLSPGHLAAKMGIAAALIYAWEDVTGHPSEEQIKILAKIFGETFPPPK
jgi:ribosome-binding protein aMBF1 (putative translation factor)